MYFSPSILGCTTQRLPRHLQIGGPVNYSHWGLETHKQKHTDPRDPGGNSCHGGHRVGRGRCWTSHAVRFADNTILSYLINVVPSIQCCVPVFSSGLRSAVRRRLTSGRTVVSVVRINSDIIGELTRQHCVHLYGSYAFRTSYR